MITRSRLSPRVAAVLLALLAPLALGGCVVYPAYPPGPGPQWGGGWYGGGGGGWHRGW